MNIFYKATILLVNIALPVLYVLRFSYLFKKVASEIAKQKK